MKETYIKTLFLSNLEQSALKRKQVVKCKQFL